MQITFVNELVAGRNVPLDSKSSLVQMLPVPDDPSQAAPPLPGRWASLGSSFRNLTTAFSVPSRRNPRCSSDLVPSNSSFFKDDMPVRSNDVRSDETSVW